MEFLLGFSDGAGYFNSFMSSYPKNHAYYKAPKPKSPVIIVLDNDDGFSKVVDKIKKIKSAKPYPKELNKEQLKQADFIHIMENLYMVLTPLGANGEDTCMEDLFDRKTLSKKVSGKSFNRADKRNNETEFGKKIFAKSVVQAQRNNITFYKFKPLLKRIVKCIDHYESIK